MRPEEQEEQEGSQGRMSSKGFEPWWSLESGEERKFGERERPL
jgi:hypothetical protein